VGRIILASEPAQWRRQLARYGVDARPLTRITRIKGSRDRIHRKIRRIKDEEAILIRA
jgi:hypothetical protein